MHFINIIFAYKYLTEVFQYVFRIYQNTYQQDTKLSDIGVSFVYMLTNYSILSVSYLDKGIRIFQEVFLFSFTVLGKQN